MEERTKVKEIGNYNPRTRQYEDSFRYVDTGDPVEPDAIDVKHVRTVGNYNAVTGEWEEAYEDRSIVELE